MRGLYNMFPEIIARNEQMKRNIYNSFQDSDKEIVKAISVDEFNKQYGQGHEVFTAESLKRYAKAVENQGLEKVLSGDAIGTEVNDSLKDLKLVIVKGEKNQLKKFLVRKSVS